MLILAGGFILLAVLFFVPLGKKNTLRTSFTEDGRLTILRGDSVITEFAIEIAETEDAIANGLKKRKRMEQQQAMLFILPEEEMHSLWMLNVYIPLDIIFADTTKEIVYIAKQTEPDTYEPVPSKAPALYAVEVNAGLCDQYGITLGDRIRFTRQ